LRNQHYAGQEQQASGNKTSAIEPVILATDWQLTIGNYQLFPVS